MSARGTLFIPYDIGLGDLGQAAYRDKTPLIDKDGLIIFAMWASLLFITRLGTYGALLFTLSALLLALRHRGAVREALRSQSVFLLFPAYAVLSTLWSEAPAETLKHSLEFSITVIAAFVLIQMPNRRSMMFALFVAFALYCLASLLFGGTVEVGTTGVSAFSGLADSKNEEASTATLGAIVSLAWLFLSLRARRYWEGLIALPVLPAEIYAAVLARSAGALAALAVGIALFLLLALLIKATERLRAVFVGFGGIVSLACALVFLLFTGPIVEFVSGWFGKDVTLTGRTYLWARARDLIVEQPILGRGFSSFWQQGNLDAEGLWQFAHVTSRSGFNFHNTGYDILVSLGWVGMCLFTLGLIAGLVRLAVSYVKRPGLLAAFWLAVGASLVVRLPVETIGTYEFSFGTIFLFASLGYAASVRRHDPRVETPWAADAPMAPLAPLRP